MNALRNRIRNVFFIQTLVVWCAFCGVPGSTLTSACAENGEITNTFSSLLKAAQAAEAPDLRDKSLSDYADHVVKEYQASKESASFPNLLKAAVAFGWQGRYDRSSEILDGFCKANPTDKFAFRYLGIAYEAQGKSDQAAAAYRTGWLNGDVNSLTLLCGVELTRGRPQEVGKLIPALLDHLDDSDNAREIILLYAVSHPFPDLELAGKATKGLSDKWILKLPAGSIPSYILGFWRIGEKSRALRLQAAANFPEGYRVLTLDPDRQREVVETYERQPELFAKDELKVVAKCYMLKEEPQPSNAMKLYEAYLEAKPDDGPAWGELGYTALLIGDEEKAARCAERGWSLGGESALPILGLIDLKSGRLDKIKSRLPDMLKLRHEDFNLVRQLVGYSTAIIPPDQKLFNQAIEGVTDEQILEEPNGAGGFIEAFRAFGQKERADRLEQALAHRKKLL